MDAVYSHVMHGVAIEDERVRQLFINERGLMDAGSSYGIVLSGEGSATVAIGQRVQNTQNITLSNVEVFGVYNNVREKMKAVTDDDDAGALRGILSDAIDWNAILDDGDVRYVGDAYTDVVFAMNWLQSTTQWYFLHCMRITDAIQQFVMHGGGDGGVRLSDMVTVIW